VQQRAMQYLK